MGKRSEFPRKARDFYPTPLKAVLPLIGHLPWRFTYVEPCAGDGRLTEYLTRAGGSCVGAYDIEPQADDIEQVDAFDLAEDEFEASDYIITNPPFPARRGEPTIGLIKHLASYRPTWLLLPADFMHNHYFRQVSPFCVKIQSVGRVSWMENGTAGKDNVAWYLFYANHVHGTRFYPRVNGPAHERHVALWEAA